MSLGALFVETCIERLRRFCGPQLRLKVKDPLDGLMC